MNRRVSFILPALNEEANIRDMICDAKAAMDENGCEYEIIVIDDGSHDGTSAMVDKMAEDDSSITLLRHSENRGYGAALINGFSNAKYELIFFTDSDRQFNLVELSKMFEHIDAADMVIGHRAPRRDPFMRRLNGWGWSLIVNTLFGYTARDIDCAFKLIKRRVTDEVKDKITSFGSAFSAELLVRSKRAGFTAIEVPIREHRPRSAGNATGASLAVIVRAFGELVGFRWSLRSQHPHVHMRSNEIDPKTHASTAQASGTDKPAS